jgi:hypothetical protein
MSRCSVVLCLLLGGAGALLAQQPVVLTFDPNDSSWILRRSYPLFVARTLDYLAQTRVGRTASVRRTGDTLVVRAGPGREVLFTDPARRESAVATREDGSAYYTATGRIGVYRSRPKGAPKAQEALHPVNLLSPEESDNAPSEQLALGEGVVTKRETAASAASDLWKWIVLGVFALLLGEWYIYNRRAWV